MMRKLIPLSPSPFSPSLLFRSLLTTSSQIPSLSLSSPSSLFLSQRRISKQASFSSSLFLFPSPSPSPSPFRSVRYYSQPGRTLDDAIEVLREKASTSRPDEKAFSVVIKACLKAKRNDEAFDLFQVMIEPFRCLSPSSSLYSKILSAMLEAGGAGAASCVGLLDQMHKDGYDVDEDVFDKIVTFCLKNATIERGSQGFLEKTKSKDEVGGRWNEDEWEIDVSRTCEQQALIDSIRFLGLRIKRKVSFSPVLLDSLLERCLEHGYLAGAVTLLVARHSGVDRAISYYDTLIEEGAEEDPVSLSVLVQNLARKDRLEEASQNLTKMAQLGIPLKPIATNQLFTALYKKQQYNKIIELFELSGGGREEGEREGGELVVDQITCTIALRACGELGELNKAVELMDEMETVDTVDIQVLNAFLNACVKMGCDSKKIEEYFKKYTQSGLLTPDQHTYNNLLNAHANEGNVEKVLQTLSKMTNNGINLDYYSYSTTMKACSKDPDKVMMILEKMKKNGIPPNNHTYSIAIAASARTKQPQKALQFFQDMREMGVTPTLYTYTTLIYSLIPGKRGGKRRGGGVRELREEEVKHLNAAFQLFEELREEGGKGGKGGEELSPGVEMYNTLLQACKNAGRVEEGVRLFEEMKGDGVKPDNFSYSTIISACGGVGGEGEREMMKEAFRYVREMMEGEVIPDSVTVTTVLNLYTAKRKSKEGIKFYEQVVERGGGGGKGGVKMDSHLANALIGCYGRVGRVDDAIKIYEEYIKIHGVGGGEGGGGGEGYKMVTNSLMYALSLSGRTASVLNLMKGGRVRGEGGGGEEEEGGVEGGEGLVSIESFNILLGACARTGDVELFKYYYEELLKAKLQLQMETYFWMLRCLSVHKKQVEKGERKKGRDGDAIDLDYLLSEMERREELREEGEEGKIVVDGLFVKEMRGLVGMMGYGEGAETLLLEKYGIGWGDQGRRKWKTKKEKRWLAHQKKDKRGVGRGRDGE